MAPTLYTPFGGDFTYLNSDGVVHAAHSGRAITSRAHPCQMEIIADGEKGFISRYSHILVLAKNKQRVEKGDAIGIIETRRDEANCACDSTKGWQKFKDGRTIKI